MPTSKPRRRPSPDRAAPLLLQRFRRRPRASQRNAGRTPQADAGRQPTPRARTPSTRQSMPVFRSTGVAGPDVDHQREQRVARPHREGHAGSAAGGRQEQALGEQLAHQPRTARRRSTGGSPSRARARRRAPAAARRRCRRRWPAARRPSRAARRAAAPGCREAPDTPAEASVRTTRRCRTPARSSAVASFGRAASLSRWTTVVNVGRDARRGRRRARATNTFSHSMSGLRRPRLVVDRRCRCCWRSARSARPAASCSGTHASGARSASVVPKKRGRGHADDREAGAVDRQLAGRPRRAPRRGARRQ